MKKSLLILILFVAVVSFFTLLFTDQSWKGNREPINVLFGITPFLYLIIFPFLLPLFKKKALIIKQDQK